MKKTVVMTVGAPGSGKSTWAENEVKNTKVKTIVLNRDDLRAMLFGGTNKTNLRDVIIAQSKIEAIKQFIIENKGQVLVYGVTDYVH